ncbi:MAG: hypothetical protein ABI778_01100 [Ignavibacteriota bacterium]
MKTTDSLEMRDLYADTILTTRIHTSYWEGKYLDIVLRECDLALRIQVKGNAIVGKYYLEHPVFHSKPDIDSGYLKGSIEGDSVKLLGISSVHKDATLYFSGKCFYFDSYRSSLSGGGYTEAFVGTLTSKKNWLLTGTFVVWPHG